MAGDQHVAPAHATRAERLGLARSAQVARDERAGTGHLHPQDEGAIVARQVEAIARGMDGAQTDSRSDRGEASLRENHRDPALSSHRCDLRRLALPMEPRPEPELPHFEIAEKGPCTSRVIVVRVRQNEHLDASVPETRQVGCDDPVPCVEPPSRSPAGVHHDDSASGSSKEDRLGLPHVEDLELSFVGRTRRRGPQVEEHEEQRHDEPSDAAGRVRANGVPAPRREGARQGESAVEGRDGEKGRLCRPERPERDSRRRLGDPEERGDARSREPYRQRTDNGDLGEEHRRHTAGHARRAQSRSSEIREEGDGRRPAEVVEDDRCRCERCGGRHAQRERERPRERQGPGERGCEREDPARRCEAQLESGVAKRQGVDRRQRGCDQGEGVERLSVTTDRPSQENERRGGGGPHDGRIRSDERDEGGDREPHRRDADGAMETKPADDRPQHRHDERDVETADR